MIRFGLNEFIRNFWFNICIILIMIVMMITTTILISNVDEQTKTYKLSERYLDNDSIFIEFAFTDLLKELDESGDILIAHTFSGIIGEDTSKSVSSSVYSEEVMKYLKPRLDEGKYPKQVNANEETIVVLMSHNPYGIGVGDTFTYNIYGDSGNIPVKVYVAGIISEGQRIYSEIETVGKEMLYEDFFPVYSYEQTETVRLIIPEQEIKKIEDIMNISSFYRNGILNLRDDMTNEEKRNVYEKIKSYEEETFGFTTVDIYPSASDIVKRSRMMYESIILKYLPMAIIVFILLAICIIGIVTIKTIMSSRYYGIMYLCGMYYKTAQFMTALEMTVNSVIAALFTISILVLQNKLELVGKINCNLNLPEIISMVGICSVIIIWSALTTRGILKENTPIQIIKNVE